MLRKVLIAFFGIAVCLTAILLLKAPTPSAAQDGKPVARKSASRSIGNVGVVKKDENCVGCTVPVP